MARNNRSDAEYEVGGLTKGIKVLEALEGTAFKPVPVKTIMERTEFPRDVVDRSLKTLRLNGYAIQTDDGEWTIGRRLIRFAGSITRHKGL